MSTVEKKLLAEWFWTDRWMGSSGFLLPMEPRGVYREMLTQAWRRGARLPNDHAAILRAIGSTAQEWKRSWPVVAKYWKVEGAYLVNETQQLVYAEALASAEKASARGQAGAKARHKKRSRIAQAEDEHVLEECPPSPSPSPIGSPPIDQAEIRPRGRLAFAGKVLEVPRFLDDEFVRRLNGQFFELTGFYQTLDDVLDRTGESWDIRWIRDKFSEASPAPERRVLPRTADDRPISPQERAKAEAHRRAIGGCPHEERCETAPGCVGRLVRRWRELEQEALTG